MERFFLPVIIFLLLGCGQKKTDDPASPTPDDQKKWPGIADIRRDYVNNYKSEKEFDSHDEGKPGEEIRVRIKYYCLFDNSIAIPGRYVWEDSTKDFTTHNYAADITIISNHDTIVRKTITKKDFTDLPSYLEDYAVIFEPVFTGYNTSTDRFDFHFSISIPVTDVGESRKLSIERNGKVIIN